MNRNMAIYLLVIVLVLCSVCSANASEAIVLKCGLPTPAGSPHYKGLEFMNEYLAKKGLVTIEIYTDSALGTERELPESVSMGTVDMAVIACSPLSNFSPSFYMLDFPYLVKDRKSALSILNGEIGRKLMDTLLSANIYGLGFWDQGFRQFENNVRPVKTVADASGLKIRVIENELYQSLFKAVGVYPTVMSPSEIITALEQGTIDGLDVTLGAIYAGGFYAGLKYVTITNHVYSTLTPILNLDRWNGFSAEIQEELRDAMAYTIEVHAEYMSNAEAEVIERLKNDGFGVDYADMAEWAAATSSIHEPYLSRVDQDIFEAFKEATATK